MRLSWEEAAALGYVRTPAPAATHAHGAVARAQRQRRNWLRSPELVLRLALTQQYGDLVSHQFRPIPGRRFTVDSAFPQQQVAVEVDGWQFHGKHKKDFHRDRDKRTLLAEQGWLVLAYSARSIMRDLDGVLASIQRGLAARR